MKLLQKTGYYFFGLSLLILLIGGIGVFYALSYLLDYEMDESLKHTRSVLLEELVKKEDLPPTLEIMDEIIDITEIQMGSNLEIFKDTLRQVKEKGKMEREVFRQYRYTEYINGKNYRIALHHSKFAEKNLLITITGLIVSSLIFILLLLNLLNRYLSQQIWRPFYHTINQIRNFSLSHRNNISAVPTNIDEFQTLNIALEQMAEKLLQDYRSLKQFTENASHEIQTPLAIILSQVELLLQGGKKDEKSLHHLHQIQQSAAKLSKLNKSLLLLIRIENHQFESAEKIALDKIIYQKLEALDLLIKAKSLKVEMDMQPVSIIANTDLADIIISNLLGNAIKHNIPKGTIDLLLTPNKLTIRNTGNALSLPANQLFERFRKADEAAKSLGLGLAIVKEICEVHGWKIGYEYQNGEHEIVINFETGEPLYVRSQI